jgi:hypothetical protein
MVSMMGTKSSSKVNDMEMITIALTISGSLYSFDWKISFIFSFIAFISD